MSDTLYSVAVADKKKGGGTRRSGNARRSENACLFVESEINLFRLYQKPTTAVTMATIWKLLLCYSVLASCSTAYPTHNPTQPITVVRKTRGQAFGPWCPNGWTLTRNTSKEVNAKCGIDWGRMYGSQCDIGYVYFWDAGLYWCETNGTTTNIIHLTVTDRPVEPNQTRQEYTVKPVLVQKFQGEQFVMSCPNYNNWTVMRNIRSRVRSKCPVVAGRHASICHSYLYPWHAGLYWCEHKDGSVANFVKLTITAGPLLLQPSAVPIVNGDDVVLTCRTWSDAAIEQHHPARFYKNNMLIGERSRRMISIYNFSSEHTGMYKCGIKTLVSPSIWLEANAPMSPENATEVPLANRSGSLSATVNGVPVAVNHVFIEGSKHLVLRCNNGANSSAEMTVWAVRVPPFKRAQRCGHGAWGERIENVCAIENVFPWDSGLYFCKSNGKSEAPLGLTVTVTRSQTYPPPEVYVIMETIRSHGSWQVTKGEYVMLYCKAANCSGKWTVWMETSEGISQCGVTKGTVFETACYIYNTNWNDTGKYWCSSEDGRRSATRTLTVVDDNSVTVTANSPIVTGDDVVLTCTFGSSDMLPEATAVFYKDNVVLARLSRGYMMIRNFTNSLHRGHYKCEILGHGESQYMLVAVEAEGDICEVYDPVTVAATTDYMSPTATPNSGNVWGGWVIALLCITPILVVCIWWILRRNIQPRRNIEELQELYLSDEGEETPLRNTEELQELSDEGEETLTLLSL